MILYDKLIRDKIPEIINSKGKNYAIRIAGDMEYKNMLRRKLLEEAEEFQDEPCKEELADVLEVFYAILQAEGFSLDDIEKIRRKKADERGAFNKKIILEKVY